MKTDIIALEYEVDRIRAEAISAYNVHRDLSDQMCKAERKLAEARKNGGN